MHDTTGYDVLKKVGEECGLNIYLRGKELRAEPRDFEHTDGRAVYDFEKNIEKDDLIYRRADEREYEVTVEGIGKGGKRKTITLGTGGGGKRKIIIPGVTDEAILRKRGEEEMKHLLYDGFDGNITGWAIPFVQAGYSVEMRNHETPTQTGTYHCTAMELDGSKAGLVRKVTLGRKLSL
jgi:hypothetical protein